MKSVYAMRSAPGFGAVLAGFALTTALVALCICSVWGLSSVFPIKAVLVFPMLAVLSVPELRNGPVVVGPATFVTLVRAALTGLVVAFVAEPVVEPFAWALWFVSGFAFFLDAVDGWVARRTATASPLGARLDMELDGLTVLGLGALLWWMDRAGAWILIAGALRYLWIAGELLLPWMRGSLFPTPWRRWLCGLQLTVSIFALLPWPWPWLSPTLCAVGVAGLLISFGRDFVYLARGGGA